MTDINAASAESQGQWSFFKSHFYLLYICIFFGATGLCFMALNIYMYVVQGLGGSALDSTLIQTFFSCGQMFGSPILHYASEKVGRKPIYSLTFVMYLLTMVGMLFAKEEYFGDFALGWLYILRIVQGFFAIVQPLAFTMISDVVPPMKRAFFTSLNNIVYLVGTLVCVVMTAFVYPEIGNIYPDDDNYKIFNTCLWSAIIMVIAALIISLFLKETCPNVLLKREAKRVGAVYKPI